MSAGDIARRFPVSRPAIAAISWPDWRGDKSVPDQRVLWTLSPEGAGTRVELVHDGFVRAVDVSDYPFGWGWFLSRIGAVAEGKALGAVPPEHQGCA